MSTAAKLPAPGRRCGRVPAAASRGLHCFVVCAPRRHGHHSQRFVAPRAAAAASRKDDNEASASSRRAEGPEDDVAELMRDLVSRPRHMSACMPVCMRIHPHGCKHAHCIHDHMLVCKDACAIDGVLHDAVAHTVAEQVYASTAKGTAGRPLEYVAAVSAANLCQSSRRSRQHCAGFHLDYSKGLPPGTGRQISASLPNVRLEFDDQGDEFESWDDIMDELEDPWMMHPVSAGEAVAYAVMCEVLMHARQVWVGVDMTCKHYGLQAGQSCSKLHPLLPCSSVHVTGHILIQRLPARMHADSPEPFAGMWDGEEVSSSGAPAGISAGASSYDSMQTVGYMELKTCVERWGNRGNIGSEVDEAAAVLLDVRSAEEFAASHVPGSTNVPLNQLRGSCAAELAAPPRPLLVVGSGDVRSAQACVRLSRVYGAMQVSHFEGGLAEYAQHAPLASSNDSGSP
eukprot:366101-Chlamydomonas_euryale.AAC.2